MTRSRFRGDASKVFQRPCTPPPLLAVASFPAVSFCLFSDPARVGMLKNRRQVCFGCDSPAEGIVQWVAIQLIRRQELHEFDSIHWVDVSKLCLTRVFP